MKNNPFTKKEKWQIVWVIAGMVLFIALAVFFWSVFKWVLLGLLLLEYAAECYKYKTAYPPMAKLPYRCHLLLFPPKIEISTTADQLPAPANVITSITGIGAKDFFLLCCDKGDYSPIGTGSPEQLHAAFTELLSQYYELKNDEQIKEYIKMMRRAKALEIRKAGLDTLAAMIKERYSVAAANALRERYPKYEFSEASIQQDLQQVGNAEIRNSIEYDQLVKRMEERERDTHQGGETNRQKWFMNTLMEIEKLQGVTYNEDTITLAKFATAQSRLHEHIEYLKKQNNGKRNK